MQQLDAVTLKALARELRGLLNNAKISKVQHPSAYEFLLVFWGGAPRPEGRNLFYIHLNPEAPFCVLTTNRRKQDTVLNVFEKPTALCMLLRKHLNGASLLDVTTLPGERVLNLVFENFNELGNKVRLVLSLELMGKHSNMILYDDVQGTILAVAHGVSERMSSYRELSAGLPYAPPPRPAGKRLLSELTTAEFMELLRKRPPEETAEAYLNRHLAGFGRQILADALAVEDEPRRLYQLLTGLENAENLAPAIHGGEDRFTLVAPPDLSGWQMPDSVNGLVETYFTGHLRRIRMERKRQHLLLALSQQEKKLRKREKELVSIADAEIEGLQATGDRLLAALSGGEVTGAGPSPGQGRVMLTRYEDGAPWPVEVDPSLPWVENAQVYYRRAKKAKARREAYRDMAEQLAGEQAYLESLGQLVRQADSLADFDALEAEMAGAGFVRQAAKPESGKKKGDSTAGVMRSQSSEGLEILVGKSGKGNEAIVGKLSRPEDWWLHVHQMPGSHVLIRNVSNEDGPPDETLLEAAMLAAWYSDARDGLNVPIIYTQSRYVRKIPQSYPGHVQYKNEQTVFVTPDKGRVQRLLDGAE